MKYRNWFRLLRSAYSKPYQWHYHYLLFYLIIYGIYLGIEIGYFHLREVSCLRCGWSLIR